MNRVDLLRMALGAGLGALWGCSSDEPTTTSTLAFTDLIPWDGGADAGCTVATASTRVGCATAYAITGDPSACAGFSSQGLGATTTCQTICKSGLTCNLSGLSNGTNVVECSATCGSPEH